MRLALSSLRQPFDPPGRTGLGHWLCVPAFPRVCRFGEQARAVGTTHTQAVDPVTGLQLPDSDRRRSPELEGKPHRGKRCAPDVHDRPTAPGPAAVQPPTGRSVTSKARDRSRVDPQRRPAPEPHDRGVAWPTPSTARAGVDPRAANVRRFPLSAIEVWSSTLAPVRAVRRWNPAASQGRSGVAGALCASPQWHRPATKLADGPRPEWVSKGERE